jgi:PAT family beta-lactamase induction signal transducer AmpG
MMLLAPKWLAGFSGVYVDAHGYEVFFTSTAFLGAPVLLLVWLAARVLPVEHGLPSDDSNSSAQTQMM